MLKQFTGRHGLRRALGFTLIGTVISAMIAGVVLTGATMGYQSLRQQMKHSYIDRQMDQYGHMALQELTNLLGWGWGANILQSGQNPRWEIVMDDSARVDNGLRDWKYWNRLDQRGRLLVTMQASRGILYNRREPAWAEDFYVWRGTRAGENERATIDRRGRMTIEGMEIDIQDYTGTDAGPYYMNHETAAAPRHRACARITLTLQYRYSDSQLGDGLTGLFANEYVRERTVSTWVYMRNWDVKTNTFRASVAGS